VNGKDRTQGWESLFECDKKIKSQAVQIWTESRPIESLFDNKDLVTLDEAVLTTLDEIDYLEAIQQLTQQQAISCDIHDSRGNSGNLGTNKARSRKGKEK